MTLGGILGPNMVAGKWDQLAPIFALEIKTETDTGLGRILSMLGVSL